MKNLVLASFIALVLGTGATAQTPVKITGYELSKYAVTGDIEKQIITQVVKPIETALNSSPNSNIAISIDGYADKSGSGGKNDDLGTKRADEVEKYLTRKVPSATFVPTLTKGDEANVRMVVVAWKITPITAPAIAPYPSQRMRWLIGGAMALGLAVATLITLTVMFRIVSRTPQSAPPSQPQVTGVIPAPTPAAREPKWFKVKGNGSIYDVLFTPKVKDDLEGLESPFTINGCPIFFPTKFTTERDITKSLKGCVKDYSENPEKDKYHFADQLEQLIAVRKVIKSESKE
jgi:hypothetical protein